MTDNDLDMEILDQVGEVIDRLPRAFQDLQLVADALQTGAAKAAGDGNADAAETLGAFAYLIETTIYDLAEPLGVAPPHRGGDS